MLAAGGSSRRATQAATAPLDFVGLGVKAPRFQHDDYSGIDVHGKIVVGVSGRPKQFATEEGAYYASSLTKIRLAARHGAMGIIELQTPEREERFAFTRVALFNDGQSIDWVTADGRRSGLARKRKVVSVLRTANRPGGTLPLPNLRGVLVPTRTSVPGLYAAGDLVGGLDQWVVSAAQGAIAATAVHNSL